MLINHFGLSGGKDSTALWGWAINESGYPIESIRGSFCDTENEYQEVYEQIDFLDRYGQARGVAPIRRLSCRSYPWAWKLNYPLFLALAIWKGRFPSAKVRFCTEWLKMKPMQSYVEELQLDGHEIILHSGVRWSESIERSVLPEWSENNGIKTRRPLLAWTIKDVWNAHTRYALKINPLYLRGRKRVGCRLCCMSKKQDVRLTVKHFPWVIKMYRKWEDIVGQSRVSRGIHCDFSSFFRRKTVPLPQRSRDIITKSGKKMKVATMDDVARWSQTLRGGTQAGFDFMFEEDDWNDFDAAAPCQSGHCE